MFRMHVPLIYLQIQPDGHCLFAAVADQLALHGVLPRATASYPAARAAAADYMLSHQDDFLPFLPSLDGEDGAGATADGIMSPRQYNQYCMNVRDTGAWGGEPEILALSRAYNVPIHVVQAGKPPVVVHEPVEGMSDLPGAKVAFISYHRRMYGLGEVRCFPNDTYALTSNSTTTLYDRECEYNQPISWPPSIDGRVRLYRIAKSTSIGATPSRTQLHIC